MKEPNAPTTQQIRRRGFLAGASSTVFTAAAASAQEKSSSAPLRGPAVWLDMDQAALDDAYNQIKYAPNLAQVIKRYGSNSDAMRARGGEPRKVAYGTTA